MAKWPDKNDLFDVDTTGGQARVQIQDWFDVTRQMVSGLAYTEVMIANDKLTPESGALLVNSENNAATDSLSAIDPVNMHDGALLHLKSAYADRKITLIHSAGLNGIQLAGGANRVLKTKRPIVLRLNGDVWLEDSASNDIATGTLEGIVPAGAAPDKILSGNSEAPSQAAWKNVADLVDGSSLKYDSAINKISAQIATSAEATAGTDDAKLMTAKKTKEAIEPTTIVANNALAKADAAAAAAAAAQTTANNGSGLNNVVVQTVDGGTSGTGNYYYIVPKISRSGNVLTLTRVTQYYKPASNCDCGKD